MKTLKKHLTKVEIRALPRVRVDFTEKDEAGYHSSWRDSGYLEARGEKDGFILHIERAGKLDGTRVFPLRRRWAEVYFDYDQDSDDVLIVGPSWPE